MKKKNRTLLLILVVSSLLIIFLLPSILFGEVYDNIGFKKDVPEEIKKACPMCDEFLDVKWIDEKRYIGKLKTEWYKDGKKQGIIHLLVKLENPGSDEMFHRGDGIIYGISEQGYYSKEFEDFIKEGEYTYGKGFFFMFANKGGQKIEFTQKPIPSAQFMKSYANFSKTICVLYPGGRYAFVIESKKPFLKADLPKELKEKYDSIIKYANGEIKKVSAQDAQIGYIKYCDAIDVNFDRLDDYIFGFNIGNVPQSRRVVIYFSKKYKYEFKDITNCSPGINIYYKPIDKKEVRFGKCNLTELIKGGN